MLKLDEDHVAAAFRGDDILVVFQWKGKRLAEEIAFPVVFQQAGIAVLRDIGELGGAGKENPYVGQPSE